MNRIRVIRRLACILAGLAGVLLAFTACLRLRSPSACHYRLSPAGRCSHYPMRTIVTGGMPGCQVTLIAS
jgi:hypothetical protein